MCITRFNDNVIDRTTESLDIIKAISNQRGKVIFLYSPTAFGKSTITKRIINSIPNLDIANKPLILSIKTPPKNKSDMVQKGEYIQLIFTNLVERLKTSDKGLSIVDYIQKSGSNSFNKECITEMARAVENDTKIRDALIKETTLKAFKHFAPETVATLAVSKKDNLTFALGYIEYVLDSGNLLFHMDNIQNMDPDSKKELINWLGKYKTNNYLFEYTLSEENTFIEFKAQIDYLDNIGINTEIFRIKALETKDAIDVLKVDRNIPTIIDAKFINEAEQFYENNSKGHIRQLQDFAIQYNPLSNKNVYDSTLERLKGLPKESIYILSIIVMHNGKIKKSTLNTILNKYCDTNFIIIGIDNIVQQLESDYDFIVSTEEYSSLVHASIIDSWEKSDYFYKYNLIAYKNCNKYYQSILNSPIADNIDKEEAVLFLLENCIKYDSEKLEIIFNKYQKIINDSVMPSQFFECIKSLIVNYKDDLKLFIPFLYKISQFLFDHNLYKDCLFVIKEITDFNHKETIKDMIYRINCLEYLENHEDALYLCLQGLKKAENDVEKYYLYLLLAGCYRSLNQLDNCKLQFQNIESIPNFKSYPQYGIFLRLKETYLTRKQAITPAKQSVKFFVKNKLIVQEIKSRITYSFLIATQDLDKAKKEINICENLVNTVGLFKNIIYLNKASILLLEKHFGDEVESLLKKAMHNTESPFDTLLILTMLLINYVESKESGEIKFIINQIIELLKSESDKHLLALVSYNLYKYYKQIGDNRNAEKYFLLANQFKSANKTVEYKLDNKINSATPTLFTIDWCVGFTFFWSVDYLEN